MRNSLVTEPVLSNASFYQDFRLVHNFCPIDYVQITLFKQGEIIFYFYFCNFFNLLKFCLAFKILNLCNFIITTVDACSVIGQITR